MMSNFFRLLSRKWPPRSGINMKDSVTVQLIGNGKYRLLGNLDVYIARTVHFTIPRGFDTDFASVPSFLHWVIDQDDDTILVPAIVHDYLYQIPNISRFLSDVVLWELMRDYGAGWKRYLVYAAVRLFGSKTVDN